MSGYNLHDMIWLGGHGPYVWASLALCVGAVAVECLVLRQARLRALRRVRRLHQPGFRKLKL